MESETQTAPRSNASLPYRLPAACGAHVGHRKTDPRWGGRIHNINRGLPCYTVPDRDKTGRIQKVATSYTTGKETTRIVNKWSFTPSHVRKEKNMIYTLQFLILAISIIGGLLLVCKIYHWHVESSTRKRDIMTHITQYKVKVKWVTLCGVQVEKGVVCWYNGDSGRAGGQCCGVTETGEGYRVMGRENV